MGIKLLFIFSLIFCLSFASLEWQVSTDGQITSKPVISNNNLIIGSADGYLYSLKPSDGTSTYKVYLGKYILQPETYSNGIFTATTEGNYFYIDSQGMKVWQNSVKGADFNATYIYGFSTNGEKVVLTTDNGLFYLPNSTTAIQLYSKKGDYTPPHADSSFILFGYENKLIKIGYNGQMLWETKITEKFWSSRPVTDGSSVYIGALDKKMHTFNLNTGSEEWNVDTQNWITGTVLVSEGIVYFGSNDGNVYAVDKNSGKQKWIAKTGQAVQSTPEIGFIGGKRVIFAGSNDKYAYAMDSKDGNIVWKGSAQGWAGSPKYYDNNVIFGSKEGIIYSYTTERAINYPQDGETIGKKEVTIQGGAVSEKGTVTVLIRINNGPWETAPKSLVEGNWTYIIDPSKKLNGGLNTISCKVRDVVGEETGSFTTVTVIHNANALLGNFAVDIKGNQMQGETTTIKVMDAEDGSAVERFYIKIGDFYEANSSNNVSVKIDVPGTHTVTISKTGFNNYTTQLKITENGIPLTYILIIVAAVLILGFVLYKKFAKKRSG